MAQIVCLCHVGRTVLCAEEIETRILWYGPQPHPSCRSEPLELWKIESGCFLHVAPGFANPESYPTVLKRRVPWGESPSDCVELTGQVRIADDPIERHVKFAFDEFLSFDVGNADFARILELVRVRDPERLCLRRHVR